MEDTIIASVTVVSSTALFCLYTIFLAVVLAYSACRVTKQDAPTTTVLGKTSSLIPFVVLRDPNWRELERAMDQYQEEISNIMNGLSRSLEVAQTSEWELFGCLPKNLLADRLQRRIDRLATLLEQDSQILQEKLLLPFPVRRLLPEKAISYTDQGVSFLRQPHCDEPPHRSMPSTTESASYDSAPQVMAHIVRDWTKLGLSIRRNTYDWCRSQVPLAATTILVPGAGLGRLAYDLACDGHAVEANDSSIVMASATHAILQQNVTGTLHPFLMDLFINEVDSEGRYEKVEFPDIHPRAMKGSLSYTIGDFVEAYSGSHVRGRYGGIVTCFFLDTATNIYEHLAVIQNVLRVGGIWIHIGPLQWHRNALLHPSADELKVRPIRMVAIRSQVDQGSILSDFFHRRKRPKPFVANRPVSTHSSVTIEELE